MGDSLELLNARAHARAFRERHVPNAIGLAVTGSYARGDATSASDVDVVCVVPHSQPRIDGIVEGHPVTCFCESEVLLLDLTYLVTIEAEFFDILDDEEQILHDSRELAETKRTVLVAVAEEQLGQQYQKLSNQVSRGALPVAAAGGMDRRLDRLCETGGRLFALSNRQLRSKPKLRHLREWLPEAALNAYVDARGLRPSVTAQSLAADWERRHELRDAWSAIGVQMPLRSGVDAPLRKLKFGETAEAILAAREAIARHCLRQLERRDPSTRVAYAQWPRALREHLNLWFWGQRAEPSAEQVTFRQRRTNAFLAHIEALAPGLLPSRNP